MNTALKNPKGTREERQAARMHGGKQALECKGRSLPLFEEQAACTDGSASLSTVSLRKCTHLQLSWETLHLATFCPICHGPNKSFISGQQASSSIPWISFAGFCQRSTQLHLCLPGIRALDMQMQYYGPSLASQAKQPALRLYQRAYLSAQQITFVLLQEI